MNYHVFIVNNTTFQYHLRYGFAGTGAGNREVSFLSKPETSFNYAVETNFVKATPHEDEAVEKFTKK